MGQSAQLLLRALFGTGNDAKTMMVQLKIAVLAALLAGSGVFAAPPEAPVQIRFTDSATGYALQPEVSVRPHRSGALKKHFSSRQVAAPGRALFALEQGTHTLTASVPQYQEMSGPLEVHADSSYRIEFLLDPLELPRELRPDDIAARRRDGATLFQGFIVDDDSGLPLRGARVKSLPSGVETTSDARGFYQLYIPVQSEAEQESAPANLICEQSGYRAEERQFLELWSRGDWTYNLRLNRGAGREAVDERAHRRQELREKEAPAAPSLSASLIKAAVVQFLNDSTVDESPTPVLEEAGGAGAAAASLRLPRNIRVEDNGVIYYVTMNFYEKHVLPHEWLASWSSNSLNAGSIAVRGYAIARINGRAPTSAYDICGSSDCQNFKVNASSSSTDKAVDYTAGYVLINANGNIASTEYSAENNSLDKDCGDGFTAPSSGCLYDPICAGRARSGHGRGMCQRGSNRWDSGVNGFPVRDWIWIVKHYYPNLRLVKGTPLIVGDDIKSRSSDCDVRACPGGGIENGVSCALITTKASGQTGVIIGGPLVITNDTKGFTWYQVRWNDAGSTTGWSCENYLERVFSAPTAPLNLIATPVATNRIDLSWTDTSDVETGFSIERAPAASGPWLEIATVEANVTTYTNLNLQAGSAWCYRVRAYNAAGTTVYTGIASATTPSGVAPTLAMIPDRSVTPGTLITFTNTATAPERVRLITDFEPFMSETANGVVLFRSPNFSSSTANFLDGAPEMDLAAVTDSYPTAGHGPGKVLYVHCNFTNASNPWLRLSTASAATFPNPVIDFTKKLRFDVYTDKTIKLAVGCRETTTPAGTAVGSDGGTSGASIEWAGVINVAGPAPVPSRVVTSNTWTTLTFDLPNEPIRSFSGGNGILSTASGLGVLEHLAIVPAAGPGVYNFYLDNFAVIVPRVFTYSLGAGAPPNANVNPVTGVFTWTPTLAQSQTTNVISVIVVDNSEPPLRATNTFTVIVNDFVPNSPPLLSPISDRTAYAGSTLVITNSAYDPNPADTLTFSLNPGAPPTASINPTTGVFIWTPTDADTNEVHFITVRVTDNGTPPMSATAGFSVTVLPPPPPNHSPLLLPVENRTAHIGSVVTFTNVAFDPDPQDTLTFSLDPGAPAGAAIDPVSGVFHWIPNDVDSNTVRYVTIRVTDDGIPPKSASATFAVTVLSRPPNQPPVLAAIADWSVHAGMTVVFTNTASDPDPDDDLSFSLDDDVPLAAEIDVLTGVFTWTPSDAESNTTNHITVQVTDDGEPPLAAAADFTIVVRPRPMLQILSVSAAGITMEWNSIPNVGYQLLYKDDLTQPDWQPLGSDLTATNSTAMFSDQSFSGSSSRFYRVRVLDGF